MSPFGEKLIQFVEDEIMFNSVKGILESQFDLNRLILKDIPNMELGERARAYLEGARLLREGFKELEKHKRDSKRDKENDNPNNV